MTHPERCGQTSRRAGCAAVRGQMIRPATGTTTKHAPSETEPTTSTSADHLQRWDADVIKATEHFPAQPKHPTEEEE
jgi:hypothetical protein